MSFSKTVFQPAEIWVEWVEPFGPGNEPVFMRTLRSTAIARMRKLHPELSEEQALESFLIINWAQTIAVQLGCRHDDHWKVAKEDGWVCRGCGTRFLSNGEIKNDESAVCS